MFVQMQTEHDQLLPFVPWVEDMPVQMLIDHCGRPTPAHGLNQPAFQALLKLADTGRVSVKLSGYAKFSQQAYPFDDCGRSSRAGRCLHARSLHVGVGLAVSCARPSGRITGRWSRCGRAVSGCRRSGEVVHRDGEEIVRIV